MRRNEGCLDFFRTVLVLILDLGSATFSLGSCGFLTVFSLLTCYSTIKAKVIVETALPFVGGKFTVFSQFVSNGISGISGISGSCGSGRFCGLVVVAVIVSAIVCRTIRLVLRTRRAVVGFVIRFI